ncbi:hypothetical protein LCGC14_0992900, partial [marine sediment metagenome]
MALEGGGANPPARPKNGASYPTPTPRSEGKEMECSRCNRIRTIYTKGLCKACYNAMVVSSHPHMQQARREAQKRYAGRHPVQHIQRCKRWREANPERGRTNSLAWRAANSERYKEAHRIRWHRRNHLKRGLQATLTQEQWQAILRAYKYTCAYCGRKAKGLTQD